MAKRSEAADEWDGNDGFGPEFNLNDPDPEPKDVDPISDLSRITFKVEPDAWVPVEELMKKFHPHNSQTRWEHEKEAIARSIVSYGFAAELITVNKWNDKIIGGHGRVLVCYERGYRDTLPVVYLNLPSEIEHRKAMLQFNKARGHQDPELEYREVQELLKAYSEQQVQADMGYMEGQIAELVAYADSIGITKNGDEEPEEDNGPEGNDGASDGSLLALANITVAEPTRKVETDQIWYIGPHVLICTDVLQKWELWVPFLTGDAIFAPYPGPFVPLTLKALNRKLVMVQPDKYIAGHIIDRYAEIHGEDKITHD